MTEHTTPISRNGTLLIPGDRVCRGRLETVTKQIVGTVAYTSPRGTFVRVYWDNRRDTYQSGHSINLVYRPPAEVPILPAISLDGEAELLGRWRYGWECPALFHDWHRRDRLERPTVWPLICGKCGKLARRPT